MFSLHFHVYTCLGEGAAAGAAPGTGAPLGAPPGAPPTSSTQPGIYVLDIHLKLPFPIFSSG